MSSLRCLSSRIRTGSKGTASLTPRAGRSHSLRKLRPAGNGPLTPLLPAPVLATPAPAPPPEALACLWPCWLLCSPRRRALLLPLPPAEGVSGTQASFPGSVSRSAAVPLTQVRQAGRPWLGA